MLSKCTVSYLTVYTLLQQSIALREQALGHMESSGTHMRTQMHTQSCCTHGGRGQSLGELITLHNLALKTWTFHKDMILEII